MGKSSKITKMFCFYAILVKFFWPTNIFVVGRVPSIPNNFPTVGQKSRFLPKLDKKVDLNEKKTKICYLLSPFGYELPKTNKKVTK